MIPEATLLFYAFRPVFLGIFVDFDSRHSFLFLFPCSLFPLFVFYFKYKV